MIEHLAVNFQNCKGIYSQRAFGKTSLQYSNQKHPPYVFAAIDNNFIDLGIQDSLQLKMF
jgi:hypothetical protein